MEGIKQNTNLPQACCFNSWLKILGSFFCVLFFMQLTISCCVSQEQKTLAKGVYHRVKKGETIWSIARAYNIKLQDLAEINNIEDPALVKEDTIIFMPGAKQVIDDVMNHPKNIDVQDSLPTVVDSPDSAKKINPALKGKDEKINSKPKVQPPVEEKEIIQGGKGRFIWPVQGRVKTRFGIQPNKTYHNWIKIASAASTKVKAASSGTVIFSSALKDYGETIIIRHEKEFATVYTHLEKRYVKIDQNVKKGESIALVGQKDEAGNAYINFEIRLRGKARNPLFFLP